MLKIQQKKPEMQNNLKNAKNCKKTLKIQKNYPDRPSHQPISVAHSADLGGYHGYVLLLVVAAPDVMS